MGAHVVHLLIAGKTNRVVCYKHGEFVDMDIEEALNMTKNISEYEFEVARLLSV
jgi:6-phosphofructokinase 1